MLSLNACLLKVKSKSVISPQILKFRFWSEHQKKFQFSLKYVHNVIGKNAIDFISLTGSPWIESPLGPWGPGGPCGPGTPISPRGPSGP